MKKILLLGSILFCNVSLALPTAGASAVVMTQQNAKVTVPISIRSHHEVTIASDVDGMQMFYFKFMLCPEDQPGRCVVRNDFIGLAKGQTYTYRKDLEGSVMFMAAGDHKIYATTEISGAASSYSHDTKIVYAFY